MQYSKNSLEGSVCLLKKFLKSRSIQNAGWLIGGNIVQKLVAFVVSIWTARYLGPTNYGLINYASAYTAFFYSLATLGINSVLVKKLIDNRKDEGTTLGTTLVLQIASSLLSIVSIFIIVFVVDFGETLTIIVAFLSSLGLLFQVLDSVKYWFQSRLDSKYTAIATIIAYIISSIYKLILLINGSGVVWFAVASSVDYLCVAAILFYVYRRKKGPGLSFSKNTAKALLKSSYPYIFSGLMVSIYGGTDKLMLKHMLSEEAVGYYGIAVVVSNLWVFVLSAIIESMKPVIMEKHSKDKEDYKKKNKLLYAIVFYVSVFVSVFIMLFAEYGVSVLYGNSYKGAVPALKIVTFYVAFSYLGVARDTWVVCEGLQKHLPKLYLGAAVINVILNFCFIPLLGACGAALASLITQFATVFVLPLFIKQMRPNVKLMIDAILLRDIR